MNGHIHVQNHDSIYNHHHHTTPTTTTRQSTFRFDGEHERVSHHIQHVHERKAIKAYLSEHSHRRVCNKNKETKHHRQAFKNHANQNRIANITNHRVSQPLQSMLSIGLNVVLTTPPTHIRFIADSFKRFRRTIYIHYHFRDSTDSHPNPFRTMNSWEPPLPDNPNLLLYIASIAQSIQHTFNTTVLHKIILF